MSRDAILTVAGLSAWYGAAQILYDIDIELGRGEVVALMGRNGAGKSTTMKAIMGLVGRRRGSIRFDGHDIFRLHQYLIGLRRRHAWLHAARTSPRGLTNTQYVYETRNGGDALLVALNVDDAPLSLSLPELGIDVGQIVAGSGAPPQSVVGEAEIEPHGWLIIAAH